MLPFKHRLSKRKDFEIVQKFGQFFSDENLALKIAKNNLSETRIGFVVGLKFSKKAAERNQAKRFLRDIFHKRLSMLKKGFDVVVMIRKRDRERILREKLEKNAERLLEKSRLLK